MLKVPVSTQNNIPGCINRRGYVRRGQQRKLFNEGLPFSGCSNIATVKENIAVLR